MNPDGTPNPVLQNTMDSINKTTAIQKGVLSQTQVQDERSLSDSASQASREMAQRRAEAKTGGGDSLSNYMLGAIEELQTQLVKSNDETRKAVNALDDQHANQENRIADLDERIKGRDARIADLESRTSDLEKIVGNPMKFDGLIENVTNNAPGAIVRAVDEPKTVPVEEQATDDVKEALDEAKTHAVKVEPETAGE